MSFKPEETAKRGRGRPRKESGSTESQEKKDVRDAQSQNATAEYEYSVYMQGRPEYRRRNEKDVYLWSGERWSQVSSGDGNRHALEWLAENRRDSFSDMRAVRAWNSAATLLRPLRLLSEDARDGSPRYIVPTRGLWLEVLIDKDEAGRIVGGRIVKLAPSMDVGVVGEVPVEITGTPGDAHVPAPPPAGSLFAGFLESSFPPNGDRDRVEALEAIQEYAGYTIIPGSPNEQIAHLWAGGGGNGKGVMKALISKFHVKAAAVNPEKLDGFGLMPLVDATLATIDELPKTFSPETMKSLISGDPMFIDRKHKDPISDFRCTARWIINSNQDFGIRTVDSSAGFFRRFIIINWKDAPVGGDRIAGIENVIFEKEAGVFLDWMLIGLLRYLENGFLFSPAASEQMKESAMTAANSVSAWADDVGGKGILRPIDHPKMPRSEVYAHYREFCHSTGREPASEVVFWGRLKSKWGDDLNTEVTSSRKGGVFRRFTNIDLKTECPEMDAALRKSRIAASLKPRRSATMVDLYGLKMEAPKTPVSAPTAGTLPPCRSHAVAALLNGPDPFEFEGFFDEQVVVALARQSTPRLNS